MRKLYQEFIASLVNYADVKHGTGELLVFDDAAMRQTLTMFQICYSPETCLEDLTSPVVQELVETAGETLVLYYKCYKLLVDGAAFSDLPNELTRMLWPALDKYLKIFNAWRIPDSTKLVNKITDTLKLVYSCIKRGGPASVIKTFLNQAQSLERTFERMNKKEFEKFKLEHPRPEPSNSAANIEALESKSALNDVLSGRETDESVFKNLWVCFQIQAALAPLTAVDLEVLCLACEGKQDYPIFRDVDDEQKRWENRVNRELQANSAPRPQIVSCVRNIQSLLDAKFDWDDKQAEGKAAVDALCHKLNTSQDLPMEDFRALYRRLRGFVLKIYANIPHMLAHFRRHFDHADALQA